MWKENSSKIIRAGMLLKNVPTLIPNDSSKERFKYFPYSIIITQPCDIESHFTSLEKYEQDINLDKKYPKQTIFQLLLCPAFDQEKFIEGTHLYDQYSVKFDQMKMKEFEKLRDLKDFRYHYIESKFQHDGLPNLIIDFKHYFTMPLSVIYELVSINNPSYILDHFYFIQISDRFAHYLQRVGIP
ncbi:MAG: hypothetical protein WC879_01715 [Melioribacteraceae bacterium]